MHTQLSSMGYQRHPTHQVWAHPDYAGIAYSDGDEIEQRIQRIIAQENDLSVLSATLRAQCTDWPSLYHLDGTRANILRPFAADFTGTTLEVGAGCGAITRYLGECGGQVLALEGSPRRAAITRARTRDLPNVEVMAERFDHLRLSAPFDVITFVGVVEYASLFAPGDGEAAAVAMLRHAASMLKPGGKVIIAIENQLGLKYFAGFAEDHLSQPMYGLEDRYRPQQPRTYGKAVLADMLQQAGLTQIAFMAAFPDYKFPTAIITEQGFLDPKFDAAALAWQGTRSDPQMPPLLAFSPELTWPTVIRNGMGLDLANSFLIAASTPPTECPSLANSGPAQASAPRRKPRQKLAAAPPLAWHFTTNRCGPFCKETRFVSQPNGTLTVECHPLAHHSAPAPASASKAPSTGAHLHLRCRPRANSDYVLGTPLSWNFVRLLSRDGWTMAELAVMLQHYLQILGALAGTPLNPLKIEHADTPIPGQLFDAAPHNILMRGDGSWQLIDEEWVHTTDLTAGQMVFRSLYCIMGLISRFGTPQNTLIRTRRDLCLGAARALGFDLTHEHIDNYLAHEALIHEEVTQRSANLDRLFCFFCEEALPLAHLTHAIAQRDQLVADCNRALANRDTELVQLQQQLAEMVQLKQLIAARDADLDTLRQACAAGDAQIAQLHQCLEQRDRESAQLQCTLHARDCQTAALHQAVEHLRGEIFALTASLSWRVTGPLRALRNGAVGARRSTLRVCTHQKRKIAALLSRL